MKRFFIYSLVGMIAAFASCDKNNPTPAQPNEPKVFTASIADTKTTVDVTTGKVSWEAGDEITVTDAASVSVVYTTADSGASAAFTKKTGETGTLGAGPYTAVYGSAPAAAQVYSETPGDLPMTASSANTSLTFSVNCGLLAVTLNKDGVSISSVEVSDGTHKYTLNCSTAQSIEGGKVFYLALPAGDYSSFTFTNSNGGVCVKAKSGSSVSIAANQIQPVSFSNLPFVYIVHDATELYDALDAVQDGEKIMLAEGTYTATKAFGITKSVILEGGYGTAPAIGDVPDPASHKAVLDGGAEYQVVRMETAGVTAAFSGLVLKNGKGATNGGGLYMTKGTASFDYVDIQNCTGNMGAGFLINGTTCVASFKNCIISGNDASGNGCNYVYGGANATFDNCVFCDNTAYGMGGGLYVYNNNAKSVVVNVLNSEFRNNKATRENNACHGGAVYVRGDGNASGTTVNIVNCTFYGNSCYNGGGAIAAYGASGKTATVNTYSCTMTGNACTTTGGGAVWTSNYSTVNNYNAIISGNTYDTDASLADVCGSNVTNSGSVVGGTVSDYLASTASSKEGSITKAYKVKTAATTAGMALATLKAAYTGSVAAIVSALEVDQWGTARTGSTAGACVTLE